MSRVILNSNVTNLLESVEPESDLVKSITNNESFSTFSLDGSTLLQADYLFVSDSLEGCVNGLNSLLVFIFLEGFLGCRW